MNSDCCTGHYVDKWKCVCSIIRMRKKTSEMHLTPTGNKILLQSAQLSAKKVINQLKSISNITVKGHHIKNYPWQTTSRVPADSLGTSTLSHFITHLCGSLTQTPNLPIMQ